ncbi:hypothetical protein Q2T43_18950 [Aeromonas veronii]|uniref:hypothetical protein n=1 Tax=Aeromonas veronii TaxID=654 RepID=UPI002665A9C1|nr:hypothetical protein [Aeromonas veronii]MDO2438289.1 hypothetical protein [Aeromonas veronii]
MGTLISAWPLFALLALPIVAAALLYPFCGLLCSAISRVFTEKVSFSLHYLGTLTHELTHGIVAIPFGILPTRLRLQRVPGYEGVLGTLDVRYQRGLLSLVGMGCVGSAPLSISMLTPALIMPESHTLLAAWLQAPHIDTLPATLLTVLPYVLLFGGLGFPFLAYARLSRADIKACLPLLATLLIIASFGVSTFPTFFLEYQPQVFNVLIYALASSAISLMAVITSWMTLVLMASILRSVQ